MSKISHIVIRDYNGGYHREVDYSGYVAPEELAQYEKHYEVIENSKPYYDSRVEHPATVVNVFYTEVPEND